jgi:hypothetical protein
MRFLFVSHRLPYPPRDGTTIPTFNWIIKLSAGNEVFLLYLKDKMAVLNDQQMAKNRSFVEKLWCVECERSSVLIRIKNELIGDRPFFLGWSTDLKKLNEFLDSYVFDVVWGSTLSVNETVESIQEIRFTFVA